MTNAEKIRNMDDCELTEFLNEWARNPVSWKQDPGETLYYLQETDLDDEP